MAVRFFIGMDDTDTLEADRGTGKLARWFESELPEGCTLHGVVRQQLLVHDDVPYTSHNSAACLVVDAPDPDFFTPLVERATAHIEALSLPGSDPGLCVAPCDTRSMGVLVEFGRECAKRLATQREAMSAGKGIHVSGHGGSNDGLIGATASVGLTAWGWSGRFIEYGGLRSIPDNVQVNELETRNIMVASLDRDAELPSPRDVVLTNSWCRPRLWGARAVLPVKKVQEGVWQSLGGKRHAKAS